MRNPYILRGQIMNHIGLVPLKAQIMRFIGLSVLLQKYRRWDIYFHIAALRGKRPNN